jgi:hypothetical protein
MRSFKKERAKRRKSIDKDAAALIGVAVTEDGFVNQMVYR